MQEQLSRFSLDAAKLNGQMIACLVVIWLVVVGTAISSIISQGFTPKQRLFWIVLVLAVPVFGILAYLPFSIVEGRNGALGSNKPKSQP